MVIQNIRLETISCLKALGIAGKSQNKNKIIVIRYINNLKFFDFNTTQVFSLPNLERIYSNTIANIFIQKRLVQMLVDIIEENKI